MPSRSSDDMIVGIGNIVAEYMRLAAERDLENFWYPNGRPEPTTLHYPPKLIPGCYKVLSDMENMT